MFRPAGSVSLYLPKRSTMPARACGMIRTVRASSTTTNSTNRTMIPIAYGVTAGSKRVAVGGCSRVDRPVGRVDVDGRALHGQHVDGLPRLDGDGVVVGLGGPDLPGQLDPPGRVGGDVLGDDRLAADQLAVAELQVGPGVQVLD